MTRFRAPHSKSQHGGDDTWLEPEELCYPGGGMHRRCRAKHKETGKLVVVRCGIPDTYFTIPVKGGGFIAVDEQTYIFTPPKAKK